MEKFYYRSTDIFDQALLDEFLNFGYKQVQNNPHTPRYNVIENDNGNLIEIDFAGIDKKDISIKAVKDRLVVKATRKKDEKTKYNHTNIKFGEFEISFILSEKYDKEKIDAKYDKGMLEIEIPYSKAEKKNTFEIQIK